MEILCVAYNCPMQSVPIISNTVCFILPATDSLTTSPRHTDQEFQLIILDFCITAILIQALDFYKP